MYGDGLGDTGGLNTGHEMTMCTCPAVSWAASKEEGGDSAPLCFGETPAAVPHPVLGSSQ